MLESSLPRGLGERLLSLRSFAPLAALPASELALVARLSSEREFQIGETLAREGEPVQAVQLIVSGRAALSRAGAAAGVLGALETVGLLPIAAGMSHHVTAIAVEPIQALEIDADLVDEVLEDDFALFIRVLRLAAASVGARPGDTSVGVRVGVGEGAAVLRGVRLGGSAPADANLTSDLPSDLLGPFGAARRLLLLRETPLFRTAPVDGLAAFAKRTELVRLAAGAALVTAGPSGQFCVVVSGRAEVSVGSGPAPMRPAPADFVATATTTAGDGGGPPAVPAETGDVIGGLESLIVGAPSLLIRARTEVHLLRGSASDLLDVIEDHHAMGRRLMAEIIALA